MKNNLKFLVIVIALIAITTSSCKKTEVYSCDPDINEWVKTNMKSIQQMDRQSLLELEPEMRIPAYRAFTMEQKYYVWVDKMEQVKSLKWSDKELNHINQLAEKIEIEWFNIESVNNELDFFLETWVTEGMDFFGWTEYEIGCLLQCIYDVDIEDENIVFKQPIGGIAVGVGVSLVCSCTNANWNDWCPPMGHYCDITVDCNETIGGCGWFWLKDCIGRCRPS